MAHAVSGGGSVDRAAAAADVDMLEKQELTEKDAGGADAGGAAAAPEGYITTLDKDGNIKEVPYSN